MANALWLITIHDYNNPIVVVDHHSRLQQPELFPTTRQSLIITGSVAESMHSGEHLAPLQRCQLFPTTLQTCQAWHLQWCDGISTVPEFMVSTPIANLPSLTSALVWHVDRCHGKGMERSGGKLCERTYVRAVFNPKNSMHISARYKLNSVRNRTSSACTHQHANENLTSIRIQNLVLKII